jgi:hypothetical protein
MKIFLFASVTAVVLLAAFGLYQGVLTLPETPPVASVSVPSGNVRIAYSHTIRNTPFYRAYLKEDLFAAEGTVVELVSRLSTGLPFETMSQTYADIRHNFDFGQTTNEELLEGLVAGRWDGTTLGEAAFVRAVSQNLPVVAVMTIARDQKDAPSFGVAFREDVVINSPDDIRGKILVNLTRGMSGKLFFKEFLANVGLNENDVTVFGLEETRAENLFDTMTPEERAKRPNLPHGVFAQTLRLKGMVQSSKLKDQIFQPESGSVAEHTSRVSFYRRMDEWMNPELSQSLLVFRKDFVENNPDIVEKVVHAYMKQVQYEQGLSREERLANPDPGFLYGLQIDTNFLGLGLPQPEMPPRVSEPLLSDVQSLMIKHGYINAPHALAPYVDNRFVDALFEREFATIMSTSSEEVAE